MEINRFADLRPRTVWDILDDAFDLYRARFALLAGVSAVACIPALIVSLALSVGPFLRMVRAAARTSHGASDAFAAALFQLMGVGLLAWLLLYIAQFVQTGVICVIVEGRLSSGTDYHIFAAWRRMLPRLPALLFSALISGLLSGGATLTGAVGELLLAPILAYQPQAILLERQSIAGGFRRSAALGGHGYGKSLGLILISRLLAFLLGNSLCLLAVFLLALFPAGDTNGDQFADAGRGFVLFALGAGLAIVLVAPLLGIASTLLYYDLRVRREGIDIEAAAFEQGYPLAPDYFGGIAANPTGRTTGRRS